MKSTVALALSCFCAQVPFFLLTYATNAFFVLVSPHSEQTNKNASGWKHQLHRQACQHPLRKRNPISCKLAGILPSCLHINKNIKVSESPTILFPSPGGFRWRDRGCCAKMQVLLPSTSSTIFQPRRWLPKRSRNLGITITCRGATVPYAKRRVGKWSFSRFPVNVHPYPAHSSHPHLCLAKHLPLEGICCLVIGWGQQEFQWFPVIQEEDVLPGCHFHFKTHGCKCENALVTSRLIFFFPCLSSLFFVGNGWVAWIVVRWIDLLAFSGFNYCYLKTSQKRHSPFAAISLRCSLMSVISKSVRATLGIWADLGSRIQTLSVLA